ncbi:hypothetical protein [Okeania sp. SIO2B9]|uniref:hypothetical protein n=1 Tax=Okeania sp. SIO2B9 TaxID=2607782 RepID=UPI00142BCF1D|nr:hypothetical protein [Okeania sp. SIO2B9]NES88032.1 hypothetical protein [Okeania sp. SIO2B9]
MEDYIYGIEFGIEDARDENPEIISSLNSSYGNATISSVLSKASDELRLDENLIALYRNYNGLRIDWSSDDFGLIGGRINFLNLEDVIKSWESGG